MKFRGIFFLTFGFEQNFRSVTIYLTRLLLKFFKIQFHFFEVDGIDESTNLVIYNSLFVFCVFYLCYALNTYSILHIQGYS